MCKKRVPEVDNSQNLQTTDLGLINLEENSLGSMGAFEIISVILLVLGIIMTCHYCNQKRKKSRMRDMNNAVQEGMSANTAVGYRARPGAPVITFEQPGTRMVTLQQAAVPSAPVQLQPTNQNPGLWEQCR